MWAGFFGHEASFGSLIVPDWQDHAARSVHQTQIGCGAAAPGQALVCSDSGARLPRSATLDVQDLLRLSPAFKAGGTVWMRAKDTVRRERTSVPSFLVLAAAVSFADGKERRRRRRQTILIDFSPPSLEHTFSPYVLSLLLRCHGSRRRRCRERSFAGKRGRNKKTVVFFDYILR